MAHHLSGGRSTQIPSESEYIVSSASYSALRACTQLEFNYGGVRWKKYEPILQAAAEKFARQPLPACPTSGAADLPFLTIQSFSLAANSCFHIVRTTFRVCAKFWDGKMSRIGSPSQNLGKCRAEAFAAHTLLWNPRPAWYNFSHQAGRERRVASRIHFYHKERRSVRKPAHPQFEFIFVEWKYELSFLHSQRYK
ncbi:MAG: hypothetical protein QF793_03865 [Candidatus Peribacteraceae bacterium]|nr:hypothetical protein [Candidatus Peribacteraceae bacterium]